MFLSLERTIYNTKYIYKKNDCCLLLVGVGCLIWRCRGGEWDITKPSREPCVPYLLQRKKERKKRERERKKRLVHHHGRSRSMIRWAQGCIIARSLAESAFSLLPPFFCTLFTTPEWNLTATTTSSSFCLHQFSHHRSDQINQRTADLSEEPKVQSSVQFNDEIPTDA